MSTGREHRAMVGFLHLGLGQGVTTLDLSTGLSLLLDFTSPNVTGRPTFLSPSTRSADQENGEPGLAKRRIFGHRIITINFAINDLYFFSEMEK